MKIIKTVLVKQVLTEKRKAQLLNELYDEKDQLLKEVDQLKFQLHKKIKVNNNNQEHTRTIRTSFQKEMKQREEKIKGVDFKIHQLNKLELGSELRDGTIQSIVDIEVGDKWDELFNSSEIIVKDGIVHEIREGRKQHD